MINDELTLQLSNRLKDFLAFFTNTLHAKVLEIETNVKSANYFQHLIRVSNSLEQYVNKDVTLFYVGFLGSYSSGKSSTINSILNLWGTPHERPTSNNPTDKNITLITCQQNVNNVFSFAKEGAVSIRTNTSVENEFLDKIVIMDTPGSGDPNIIAAVVRDSLPLCDLIIYALNATAPFTEVDQPFLEQQQSKLKNIPLLFVLTRGDDFKIDETKKISDTNFNRVRYENELQTLINRIHESVPGTKFTFDDFIVIDNKTQFHIDELKNKIRQNTVEGNNNLVVLHNHKLFYFNTEIQEIYRYYLELTESKIDKAKKFSQKAESNTAYFDNQIEGSKTKYRVIWSDYLQRIERIYDGTIKGYIDGLFSDLELVTPFVQSKSLATLRNELFELLKQESEKKAFRTVVDFELKGQAQLQKFKETLTAIIDFNTLSINISTDNLAMELDSEISFPMEYASLEKDFFEEYKDSRSGNLFLLKKIVDQLSKSLAIITPIEAVNKTINDYKVSVTDVLDIYYAAVKMYEVAVFSFELKSYISDLGLADKLGQLEVREIDKAKYNLLAETELLSDFDRNANIFITEIENLTPKSKSLVRDIAAIPPFTESSKSGLSQVTTIKRQTVKPFSSAQQFLKDSAQKMIGDVQNQLVGLKFKIKTIQKARSRRYVFFILAPTLVLTAAYFTYIKLKGIQTPTNLWATLAIAIGTSLLSTVITRLTDRFENYRKELVDSFKTEINETNKVNIDEFFGTFKARNLAIRNDLQNEIFTNWKRELEEVINQHIASIKQDEELLIQLRTQTNFLMDEFKKIYHSFHVKLLSLFNNYELNISKISEITEKIKEETIKPSFDLIGQTQVEVENVKKQIEMTLDNKF